MRRTLSKQIISAVAVLTMITCQSQQTIASAFYTSPAGFVQAQEAQVDYASIVEHLDLDVLVNFIQEQKMITPSISDEELNKKLAQKIMEEGNKINVSHEEHRSRVKRSYADLPYIKKKLGRSEKKLFNKDLAKGVLVLDSAKTAMDVYSEYFDSEYHWEDDNGDAFRHGVWMMLSACRVGEHYAKQFGIAHEDDHPSSELARKMDLFNNKVGVKKARNVPGNVPANELEEIVFTTINDAVKNGELRRFKGTDIKVKSELVPTNSTGSKR